MSSLPALFVVASLVVGGSSATFASPASNSSASNSSGSNSSGSNSSGSNSPGGKKPSSSEPGPRVVEPADRKAFYRDGWRALLGRRIHLHVEAEVLRRAPEKFVGADRRPRLRFANRSVALVVDPGDPEWRKAMEDRDDTSEFCLHGIVRLAPPGTRALAQLDVDSVKRAPGSRLRKSH